MNKFLVIISLLVVIGLITQHKLYISMYNEREDRYNTSISNQATSVAIMVQYEDKSITETQKIIREIIEPQNEPTYTPQPTYTPEPTYTPIVLTMQTTPNSQINKIDAPSLSIPTIQPKFNSPELSASDVGTTPLTLSETWLTVKTMLNDLGLWQPAQVIFVILFVIIAVLTFLSYFKA